MSSDAPRSRNQGWKQAAEKGATAAPGQRAWQQTQAAGADKTRKPLSKRTKMVIAAVLLGVGIYGIALLIAMLIPAKPARLLLVGSAYEDNLLVPHNIFGWKGARNLKDSG